MLSNHLSRFRGLAPSLDLQTSFAQRAHRRFATEIDGSIASGASWIAAACRRAHLLVEVQPPVVGHADFANVVCWVPSRGPSAGYEYMLLSTSIDAGALRGQKPAAARSRYAGAEAAAPDAADQATTPSAAASDKIMPHEAFIALALGRRLVTTAAGDTGWLAKDAVFLFTVYSRTGSSDGDSSNSSSSYSVEADAAAHAGVAAFMQAHDYDAAAQGRSAALHQARAGSGSSVGGALRYLSTMLMGQPLSNIAPQPAATPAAFAANESSASGQLQLLANHHGQLRVALHLRSLRSGSRPAAVPSHVGLSLAAPDGRMPELDLYTLSVSSLALSFRVVPGGEHALAKGPSRSSGASSPAVAPAEGKFGGGAVAADSLSHKHIDLVDAADAAIAHAGAAAMTAVSTRAADAWLHNNVMKPVALPLLNALHGRPMLPSSGDVAEYLSRLTAVARFAWRALWGPFAPSALLVRSGYPALSLTLGRHGDFFTHAAESKAARRVPQAVRDDAPVQLSDCRVLNPCHYKQHIAGSAEARESAAWSSSGGGESSDTASAAAERTTALGAGLERILRAMSGTDERLHASLYGYFPLGPTLFVGMHEYLSAAGPAHLPMLLALIAAAPVRDAVVQELLLAVLLLGIAAVKGSLLLAAGPSAAAPGLTLQRAGAACALIDAACVFALLPLLRRLLARVRWCERPVPTVEDAALVERISLKPKVLAAQISSTAAQQASAARRCCRRRTPAAGQQRQRRRIACGGPLLPSLWVAWLLFAYQQLQLMYASHVLFLATAAIVVPALVPLCSAWLARRLAPADVAVSEKQAAARTAGTAAAGDVLVAGHVAPPAAPTAAAGADYRIADANSGLMRRLPAATLVLLCAGAGYAAVSPAGWAVVASSLSGAEGLLGRVVELCRGYGALHLPVMLHLQALFVLVASSAVW